MIINAFFCIALENALDTRIDRVRKKKIDNFHIENENELRLCVLNRV